MEDNNPSITINDVVHHRTEMETDLERDVFDSILNLASEERSLNIRLISTQFAKTGMVNTLIGLKNGEATTAPNQEAPVGEVALPEIETDSDES